MWLWVGEVGRRGNGLSREVWSWLGCVRNPTPTPWEGIAYQSVRSCSIAADMAHEAVTSALTDAGLQYQDMQAVVASYCYGDPACGQRAVYGETEDHF